MSLDEGIGKLSDRVVETTTELLDHDVSRRSFLMKMTLVGSALAVGPLRYLLRPQSAWATISCPSGCTVCCQQCDSSATCCSSPNSTFCCTLYGTNDCPGDTTMSGWWYCSVPSYVCGSGIRYFIDCNSCEVTCCECAGGSCGNRKSCCNFRQYTNCNGNQGLGKIRCRIVRCTNPGTIWPSQCSTTGPAVGTCGECATCIQCP